MRSLLIDESFAYGFTIAFWGSGLLLINEYGLLHTGGILAYAVGAISGFGVLAVLTFGGAVDTVEMNESPAYVVVAAIHYFACLIPITLTHFILTTGLDQTPSLFLTGAVVSIFYNGGAAFEELLTERILGVDTQS